jgi:hypothetical protein
MHNINQYFEEQINEWVRINGEYSETNQLYYIKEQSVVQHGRKHVNMHILTTTREGLAELETELANYEYVAPDVPGVVWPKFAAKEVLINETK